MVFGSFVVDASPHSCLFELPQFARVAAFGAAENLEAL
jgi:hypothetical protein